MMIRRARTYPALLMLLLFCCYYSGISMFSHVHIKNGTSVVHSHLGGDAEHDHSESQYAVIDILSNFQSEGAVYFCGAGSPLLLLYETRTVYEAPVHLNEAQTAYSLRGPPQC